MNYRDFYKNKKSNRKPVSESMEEKELLKGMNLEDNSCDDGLPKRDDGSLDIEHDGRPIHLSKIISVGAEFGHGPASGEVSGMSNVGVPHRSQGANLSKDEPGPDANQDGDTEPLTAGGKPIDSNLASKTVGGKVTGGQKQGGPNTKGSIAETPKIGGGVGEKDAAFTLQEARTKLRGMVKDALKEITFDKKSGKWIRLDEGKHKTGCECGFCKNKGTFGKKKDEDKEDKSKKEMDENHDAAGFPINVPGRPQYKVAGPQYRVYDDRLARTMGFEPEITEMYDEEEECMQHERYNELVNAQRNLSESELSELKDLGMKLERKDDWIKGAVNKGHKGYCTPMTKKTCTPPRKALAKRFKSGDLSEDSVSNDPNHELSNWGAQYSVRDGASQAEQPGKVMRSRQIQKSPRVNETPQTLPPSIKPIAPPRPLKPRPVIPNPLQPIKPNIRPRPKAVNEKEALDDMTGEIDEAGLGAVQHSSYRAIGNDKNKGAHGNLPQSRQRWRNDVDENKK